MRLPWDRGPAEEHPSAHWFGRMLSALYISTFMIRASFAIMLIAFPVYIIGLKSYFLFGLVLSSSPLFELITVLGLGAYIDKRGRKRVLLMGLLVGSVALFGLLLTKDAVPLFVINAFHGMSAAAILVASLALLADYAPPERRGKVMGAFDFVNIFGWISGFGIGGLLIDVYRDDIGMTFVIAGAMGLAAFAYALLNISEPKTGTRRVNEISFSMIASVLKQRSVILLIAPWFIIYLLISTMLTFTSKAGTQELGLSGLELGLLLGGGGGVFLVTQVIYGHLSDKYGRTRIMAVGTIGIVGIMLTVGTVFLGAPAAVAPAAHTMEALDFDGAGQVEYIVQSDYGLYVVDDDGTVLKEIGPPEGGFGQVHMVIGSPPEDSRDVVLSSKDALEVFSLDSESITWAEAAHEPTSVDARDTNRDGDPEILFADASGIHITGPNVPSFSFVPPAVAEDEQVLDLAWYASPTAAPGLVALVSGPAGVLVHVVTESGSVTFALDGDFDSILWPGGRHLVVQGPSMVTFLNETTGDVQWSFGVPSGWRTAWVWTAGDETANGSSPADHPDLHLLAYGPRGGGAILFRGAGAGAPTAEPFTVPGGFRVATVSYDLFSPGYDNWTLAGLADNGSFVRTFMDLGTSPPTASVVSVDEVLVVRESAQSVFGQLTSIPVAATIGIFALMAGAFGPAALAGLTDVAQEDKRGTTMGLYSVVISTSMIVGPVVTGYLVDHYGGFGVMVFLAASAAAMAFFMALRAWDVRRAGGEEALHAKTRSLRADGKDGEEE